VEATAQWVFNRKRLVSDMQELGYRPPGICHRTRLAHWPRQRAWTISYRKYGLHPCGL